ncbi:MAG: FAD:protein FMN transferase [Oscillospiraceae bacterium]|nr:FAD:protein FMN transferase [Oscillospiraceae bacterium]
MRKRTAVISLISLLLASTLLSGCSAGNGSGEVYSDTAFMLDTVVSVKIYGVPEDEARAAVDAAFSEIAFCEDLLSSDISGNGIDRLERNAGSAYTELDGGAVYVLEKAIEYAELTSGAFDPTVGPVVALWNIRNGSGYVPTEEERAAAAALVDYSKVLFDGDGRVKLADAGMSVNLGAIAKGYIADRVKNLLSGMGIEHAVISLGGNVLAFGGKPDGSDFIIGIQDPFGPTGEIVATVAVRDMSVVSSGDYERYFEQDGVRYHHIMDPFTGAPADSGLSGVTILSEKSIDGDALSTAVFVLGRNEGLELIESLDGVECVLIGSGGERTVSSGLKDNIVFR